jgi:hypothetical protein
MGRGDRSYAIWEYCDGNNVFSVLSKRRCDHAIAEVPDLYLIGRRGQANLESLVRAKARTVSD